MRTFRIIEGDALETLKAMPDASVDAVVTDPPYELNFMGKGWDNAGVSFRAEMWRAVYDSLKDGSRLLAFGGTRTYHRIACAIEDAGFTIEDCIMWIYGQGFPKHKSKLKPAYEPILVARKGGASHLNIDACRIETDEIGKAREYSPRENRENWRITGGSNGGGATSPLGRWPANVILDQEAAQELDRMSGTLVSSKRKAHHDIGRTQQSCYGKPSGRQYTEENTYGDSGGASRFFYCPKADRNERDAGLQGMPLRDVGEREGRNHSLNSGLRMEGGVPTGPKADSRKARNHHPTVKPLSLMCWLVRLITPEGGTVLDPFTGSGSTGIAALREGFNFIGIERESEYIEIARRRIAGDAPLLNTEAAA